MDNVTINRNGELIKNANNFQQFIVSAIVNVHGLPDGLVWRLKSVVKSH